MIRRYFFIIHKCKLDNTKFREKYLGEWEGTCKDILLAELKVICFLFSTLGKSLKLEFFLNNFFSCNNVKSMRFKKKLQIVDETKTNSVKILPHDLCAVHVFSFSDGILGHSWRDNGRCKLHPASSYAWFFVGWGCSQLFPANRGIFKRLVHPLEFFDSQR